jgi:3(or 17)beta-hydroxysteroid dehydrogenase
MSSLSAIAGMSAFCAYSASKGAVTALTRNIAAYCKNNQLKIRCNAIHPDGIRTPMIMGLMQNEQPGTMPEVKDPNQAMTRMAEPRDIANMVLYLASDESRFVNGAELRIDNGWTVWADR